MTLRQFLIVSVALGVGGGLLLRLLLTDPRAFQTLIGSAAFIFTVVGLLVAAIVGNARRRSRWERPRCAACREPLGHLSPGPEIVCSACKQPLRRLEDLTFEVTPTRNWRLLGLAIAAALAPVAAAVLMLATFRGGTVYTPITTESLVKSHLPDQVNQWDIWRELIARRDAGSLTGEHVDAICRVVAGEVRAMRGQGGSALQHHAEQFLSAPEVQDLASDAALADLANAMLGLKTQLVVNVETPEGWRFEFALENSRQFQLDIGVRPVWDVTRVTIDGQPINPGKLYKRGEWVSRPGVCGLILPIPPGEHTVRVEGEAAFVRSAEPLDCAWPFERSAKAKWPTTIKTWAISAETEVTGSEARSR